MRGVVAIRVGRQHRPEGDVDRRAPALGGARPATPAGHGATARDRRRRCERGAAEALGLLGQGAVGAGALLGAAIQIAAFRIGPIVIAKEAGLTGAAFIVADAAIRLALLLGMLLLLSLFRPFRKILKYHGAEHQAIAAHEAGHPLTAAAAAGFSRFHPRCGTSFLVVSAVVSIAVYGAVLAITGVFTYPALIATRLIGAPIVTAIAFELQRQAARLADARWRFLSCPGHVGPAPHHRRARPARSSRWPARPWPWRSSSRPSPDPRGSGIPRPIRRRRWGTLSLQSRLRLAASGRASASGARHVLRRAVGR